MTHLISYLLYWKHTFRIVQNQVNEQVPFGSTMRYLESYTSHWFSWTVFTEMSSLLCRSNGHWRGRSNGHWRGCSFAASVPSDDASKVPNGRKRVSKDERKAMVLSFVNEYSSFISYILVWVIIWSSLAQLMIGWLSLKQPFCCWCFCKCLIYHLQV